MNCRAFTLMELMVVVIIVGVMALFAIPDYTKSVERAHRKDAEGNLLMIQAAQRVYAARHADTYWGPGNLGAINSNLELNLLANGATYNCGAGGATFTCTAVRGAWTVSITETSAAPSCAPVASCP